MLRNKPLIVIIILAAILRLVGLSHMPAGLNADEAALGYNAYSLIQTGRDEHGHFWPINLESFGDFKPAFYSYLLIPFIKILGLTEFAVRLPSALAGIFSVYLIYLLVQNLSSNPSPEFRRWGLISALLFAISPWHLQYSRGAWEVNLASTFILLAIYNLLLYFKYQKFKNFVICGLGFVASLYTYQSARIFVPIFVLLLFTVYYKHFKFGQLIKAIPIFLLTIPVYYSLFTSASSRFSGVGFTSDIGPVNRINELRGQHSLGIESIVAKVLHNRPVIYTIQFIQNYLSHFDGNFLFINGDVIERNKVPETGQFYLLDATFLLIGFVSLIRFKNKFALIIWLWLLVAPVAASLTFQVPHALRAQIMLYPMIIIIALGISKLPKLFFILLIPVYLLFTINYLHNYYIHYPKVYPGAWQYGFKDMVAFVKANQDRYQRVVITDKYDQPYILYLFYTRYSPAKFQTEHVLTPRDRFNFSTVNKFNKFEFTSTPWAKVRDWHDTLIVAAPEDIPEVGVNIVKTIYYPNGHPAFKIISN